MATKPRTRKLPASSISEGRVSFCRDGSSEAGADGSLSPNRSASPGTVLRGCDAVGAETGKPRDVADTAGPVGTASAPEPSRSSRREVLPASLVPEVAGLVPCPVIPINCKNFLPSLQHLKTLTAQMQASMCHMHLPKGLTVNPWKPLGEGCNSFSAPPWTRSNSLLHTICIQCREIKNLSPEVYSVTILLT